jgi:endonuclease YncB( thermonuclease family)
LERKKELRNGAARKHQRKAAMKKTVFALLLCLCSPAMAGAETYGNIEPVVYLRNYDGDTITVDLPGLHPLIGSDIPVRIGGIDVPEIKGRCDRERRLAHEAKAVVAGLLSKAKRIALVNVGRDKYFRIDATVVADGIDVGAELIRRGLAVPYDGGTKTTPWCE